jgi:RimJ/RimL family protein N-acetyltransferase
MYRLRPIQDADAQLVLDLRSDPSLTKFLPPLVPNLAKQLTWLNSYYAREGDYYFVIERNDSERAEGVISLYDVADGKAEWGRWILRPDSLAAVESAWLLYCFGFDVLGLREIYCHTVKANEPVVSFHDSCGLPRKALLANHFDFGGVAMDAIEHSIDAELWREVGPNLERLSKMNARRLNRG